MKKILLQAVIFSIVIHLLIIGFPIAKGYVMTKYYNPSIENHYENVHILQNEVAFGFVYNSGGAVLLILSFLVGVACFMLGEFVLVRLLKR